MRVVDGLTPLMLACRLADTSTVRSLIVDVELDERNDDGNTALWLACYSDNIEIIALLAVNGADLNNQNNDGVTALIYAASAGKVDVVRCLLALGADHTLQTVDGFTALDIASSRQVMKLLRDAYTPEYA